MHSNPTQTSTSTNTHKHTHTHKHTRLKKGRVYLCTSQYRLHTSASDACFLPASVPPALRLSSDLRRIKCVRRLLCPADQEEAAFVPGAPGLISPARWPPPSGALPVRPWHDPPQLPGSALAQKVSRGRANLPKEEEEGDGEEGEEGSGWVGHGGATLMRWQVRRRRI